MIEAADGTDRQPVSGDVYRRLLSHFASGVTVVTVRTEAEIQGMTVSAFAAVSLDPPLVLVCIDHRARTLPRLLASGRFCVSILHSGQEAIANHFAGRGGGKDPRMDDAFSITSGGAAVVRNCVAYLECRAAVVHEAGDHSVVIGLVEEGAAADGALPLVHWRSQYHTLVRPAR